ncbi:MAG: adenylate/guanylate cyclase domain-containing protein [Desulfobacterales bacterium]|nr:adenylate/guanylate cyclase domain-containing protein [Desulfobacterales bacterium]
MDDNILKLKSIFNSFNLNGSKDEVRVALTHFETETRPYRDEPRCHVAILWMKNIFLQNLGFFPRAEEILDHAIELIDASPDVDFGKWELKINLSLGHIHRTQCNYVDARFFLQKALKQSSNQNGLIKFQGEIYSLLADVCLHLNEFAKAREYVTAEREMAYENHIRAKGSDDNGPAIIYAYSLIDFCRIKRIIGLADHTLSQSLENAMEIFKELDYQKGLLRAGLEYAQLMFVMNFTENALVQIQSIQPDLESQRMYKDYITASLLETQIHRKMLDYGLAEEKLTRLLDQAKEKGLAQAQITSDVYFELGGICYDTDREAQAMDYYKESAKIGMLGGVKRRIIRAFNAARLIDKQEAKIFLTSDLIYQDAAFFRNRLATQVTPFNNKGTREKLFASTLFVDIAGFSSLMKNSDENTTVQMIDELIDRLCIIIHQNNGYIDKFLGDGFMAIFEHGDLIDPKVALGGIQASVDMNRAINNKNRQFKAVYGLKEDLSFRMGISTGEIYALFLGNYIKREFTYLGNAVNLASKLESVANEKGLLMDKATHELVEHHVVSQRDEVSLPSLGRSTVYHFERLKRAGEI